MLDNTLKKYVSLLSWFFALKFSLRYSQLNASRNVTRPKIARIFNNLFLRPTKEKRETEKNPSSRNFRCITKINRVSYIFVFTKNGMKIRRTFIRLRKKITYQSSKKKNVEWHMAMREIKNSSRYVNENFARGKSRVLGGEKTAKGHLVRHLKTLPWIAFGEFGTSQFSNRRNWGRKANFSGTMFSIVFRGHLCEKLQRAKGIFPKGRSGPTKNLPRIGKSTGNLSPR